MVRKTKKDKFAEYIVEYIDNNPILKKNLVIINKKYLLKRFSQH